MALSDAEISAMMDPGLGFTSAASDTAEHQLERTINSFSKSVENANAEEEDKDTPRDDTPAGNYTWGDTPTYADQYVKFPDLCRLVGPEMAVFNVTNSEELAKLNVLMAKQNPTSAPGIVIVNKKENFHEGKWYVLLEYYRVEYKTVLTTS